MNKAVRVQRADGETTYNRILEAAGKLFASNGFAETTNKIIAASARVDLASINYHFKSRSGLYEAVLLEAHHRLISIESLQQVASSHMSGPEKLKKLMEGLVESAVLDQGWHARVLSRELLSPSSHVRVLQKKEITAKLQIVLGILSKITDIPVGDPSLLRCLISVMAPCAMMLVVGRNVAPVADEIRRMPRRALVEHLYKFAIGGLDAIGRESSARRK
ncbi:TetR/AcrR family transcriptional regulator [Rhodoplanes roseus]|uniref:Transcriptional regulator n=1 Tax=Rhodoplanes roseus TaxID=29409 RepID=A0A327L2X9_9BRAD|nr:TetR/AcrR family transcriptional regulator [Rhodoplanes roseus]RAI44385.1 transcriptional regulator [Rhodoplanes roseus]